MISAKFSSFNLMFLIEVFFKQNPQITLFSPIFLIMAEVLYFELILNTMGKSREERQLSIAGLCTSVLPLLIIKSRVESIPLGFKKVGFCRCVDK